MKPRNLLALFGALLALLSSLWAFGLPFEKAVPIAVILALSAPALLEYVPKAQAISLESFLSVLESIHKRGPYEMQEVNERFKEDISARSILFLCMALMFLCVKILVCMAILSEPLSFPDTLGATMLGGVCSYAFIAYSYYVYKGYVLFNLSTSGIAGSHT